MKKLKITVGAKTDIGNVKQVNQDALLCKIGSIEKNEFGLFVVCDGLGGLEYGEIASKKTTEYFEEWWNTKLKFILKSKNNEKLIRVSLEEVLIKSNEELLKLSEEINSKVGTTASALFILNNNYYIVHIGDSRIYEVKKGMVQLTEDHSQYEMLKKQGIKNLENVKKNVLTQCIGVNEKLDIFYKKGKVSKDTNFLICSDGLHNKMEEESVTNKLSKSKTFTSEELQNICESLIDEVKEKKERDNITALLINVREKRDKNKNMIISVICLLSLFSMVSGALLIQKEKEIKSLQNEISKNNSKIEILKKTLKELEETDTESEDTASEKVKNELKSLIDKAEKLHTESVEGSKENQYETGSKGELLQAINKAGDIYREESSNEKIIKDEINLLQEAMNQFKIKKIKKETLRN